jgi:hypothetical protein
MRKIFENMDPNVLKEMTAKMAKMGTITVEGFSKTKKVIN